MANKAHPYRLSNLIFRVRIYFLKKKKRDQGGLSKEDEELLENMIKYVELCEQITYGR